MWVTYGQTESGDDLDIVGWDHRPTDYEVENLYRKLYPEEYDEPGFVNWSIDVLMTAYDIVS